VQEKINGNYNQKVKGKRPGKARVEKNTCRQGKVLSKSLRYGPIYTIGDGKEE
jgi:hypothetical protein